MDEDALDIAQINLDAPDALVLVGATQQPFPIPSLQEEEQCVFGSSPLRSHQFTLGRAMLRAGLRLVGCPLETPIMIQEGGGPDLPFPLSGSVSHSSALTAVAVTTEEGVTLGVDIETDEENFESDDWSLIATKKESAALANALEMSESRAVNILFSAKEAIYKSVSPYLYESPELGFQDVCCEFSESGKLRVEYVAREVLGYRQSWARLDYGFFYLKDRMLSPPAYAFMAKVREIEAEQARANDALMNLLFNGDKRSKRKL